MIPTPPTAARLRAAETGIEPRNASPPSAASGSPSPTPVIEQGRAGPERIANRHVEAGDVVVVDRRADIGEVVVERGVELVGSGDDDRGPRVDQLEERTEAIGGQELGERPLRPVLGGVGEGRLGEQPVIGIDLGGRGELDPLGLASERCVKVEK